MRRHDHRDRQRRAEKPRATLPPQRPEEARPRPLPPRLARPCEIPELWSLTLQSEDGTAPGGSTFRREPVRLASEMAGQVIVMPALPALQPEYRDKLVKLLGMLGTTTMASARTLRGSRTNIASGPG